jgi:glycosyltransferase involved in cell wall biosynthesis
MIPRVSVIVPTYNRGQYIAQALESVFAQTFRDYEIIVIDDGSTDNTQEILKNFEGRIRSLYQENQGISKTRNRAIKESTGEFIAFLDSDDFWEPIKLEEQVKILDSHPDVGIVYARMPIINENGETIGMKPAGVSGRNFRELLQVWGDLPTSTVMTRRVCFEKVGLFEPDLEPMEDIDMWIRIARYFELYEVENKVLAYYRRHEEQVTKNKSKVYTGLVRIYTKIYNAYPEAPKDLMIKRIVENQYLLAKVNYHDRQYKNAFSNAIAAIMRYPLLGLYFIKNGDPGVQRVLKLFKPYGFMILSFFKSLRHPS